MYKNAASAPPYLIPHPIRSIDQAHLCVSCVLSVPIAYGVGQLTDADRDSGVLNGGSPNTDAAHLHHSVSWVACQRIGRARVLEHDRTGILFFRAEEWSSTTTAGVPRNGRHWPYSDVCIG